MKNKLQSLVKKIGQDFKAVETQIYKMKKSERTELLKVLHAKPVSKLSSAERDIENMLSIEVLNSLGDKAHAEAFRSAIKSLTA